MAELQRVSLKVQVYRILREKILHQEYALGEKINIDTLAEELKISNSPIREALMMLEKDGLIEFIPNNGARVVSFSETGFHEIASTLYVMLYGAYRLCVKNGTIDKVIADMEEYLKQQQEYSEAGDLLGSVQHALMFDKSIITGAGNSYLLSIYERIEDVFYLMALHDNQRGEDDRLKNLTEHRMILKSIRDGNPEEVRKWLDIHYDKHL